MTLEIDSLKAGYGGPDILKSCSFMVKNGETLVLMGPSGSGKTTLLLSLVGVVKLSSGHMMLAGRNLSDLPIEARNIGYLPQDYGLFPHLDVGENVEYGMRMRGVPKEERGKVAEKMLKLVNLDKFADRRIQELSGGQKQRVGLARALAVKPDLILLDEPLSNVDQITKFEVAHNLRDVFDKIQIPKIVVTHTLYDAFVLADRLAIMLEGRIVQLDTPERVRAHPQNETVRMLMRQLDVENIRRK